MDIATITADPAQEAHKVMERHRQQQWLSSGQHRQHY